MRQCKKRCFKTVFYTIVPSIGINILGKIFTIVFLKRLSEARESIARPNQIWVVELYECLYIKKTIGSLHTSATFLDQSCNVANRLIMRFIDLDQQRRGKQYNSNAIMKKPKGNNNSSNIIRPAIRPALYLIFLNIIFLCMDPQN